MENYPATVRARMALAIAPAKKVFHNGPMNSNDLIYHFANENVLQASGLVSLLLTQNFGIGIAVKGLDGRYRLVNSVMEEILEQRAEDMTGRTDTELFPPEVVARLNQSDQHIIDGVATASDSLDLPINGHGARRQCQWLKFPLHGPDGHLLFIGAAILDAANEISMARMRDSLEQLQQTNQELQQNLLALDQLASTDKLTGTWNRRRLEDALFNEMDRLRRYAHPLSLLVIDIDFFKKVNDLHCHAVGDRVLVTLAAVLQSSLRATDSLTRWGGEEFVVLCPNTTLVTAAMLAERLREGVANAPFPELDQVTVSVGVAECLVSETWEQWFKRADAALYRAKASGRNQVQAASETPQRDEVGEKVAANFVSLSWHAAYECGHALIDAQHRGLFDDANRLLGALLSGHAKEEVSELVDVLMADVRQHFRDEEAISAAAGYPGASQHAAIHQGLVERAAVLVASFHAGTLGIGELFQFLAHDVVARHMLGADRAFFGHLRP